MNVVKLFSKLSADLQKVRPESSAAVVCPLCLDVFLSTDGLSIEHVLTSKLGGTTTTLTCRRCNNSQGSKFDAQLVAGTRADEALEGLGSLKGTLHNSHGPLAFNYMVGKGTADNCNTFTLVAKACDPRAIDPSLRELHDGATLNVTFDYDFVPERYWAGAIRSAYLAAFTVRGYAYVYSAGGAQVRNVLDGKAPVPQYAVMAAYPEAEPPSELLVMSGDYPSLVMVLLRLVGKQTRYLNIFLPSEVGLDWDVLKPFQRSAGRLKVETTPETWTEKLVVHLDLDPATQIHSGRRRPF